MKETFYKKHLVRILRNRGAHVTLIENMVGNGCPDLHVAFQGREFWAELKSESSFMAKGLKIRQSQFVWMTQRKMRGLDTHILAKNHTFYHWTFSECAFSPLNKEYVLLTSPAKKEVDNWPDHIHLVLSLK